MNIDIPEILEILYEMITFEIFIKFAVVYFFVIWIAILLWVIKDISNRTNNLFLQILSIFTILFLTPFGIFIYLLIRPGKTLFEKYYEEIEDNLDLFNQIVEEKSDQCDKEKHCFKCSEPISYDFKFCPKCKVKLKTECLNCSKFLYSDWKVCPYCGEKQKKKEDNKGKRKGKNKASTK